jgi:hypothetical protein
MNVKVDSVVSVAEGITVADLDGEAIILDINSGQYFGLNKVGAEILSLIKEPRTVDEVIDRIAVQFEADRGRVQDDVLTFIQDMSEAKLVRMDVKV